MRECPAAKRPIEAFECAEGRHTTYACPESCPFNVFATASYQKFQAIEHSAHGRVRGRLSAGFCLAQPTGGWKPWVPTGWHDSGNASSN